MKSPLYTKGACEITIENERYDPSLALAFEIARVFEMPIEAIFSAA